MYQRAHLIPEFHRLTMKSFLYHKHVNKHLEHYLQNCLVHLQNSLSIQSQSKDFDRQYLNSHEQYQKILAALQPVISGVFQHRIVF